MNLSAYRPIDRAVDEHLRYITHDGDGVIRTKPNGFLVGYEFRGPDLLGTSWNELTYHADAVARVFAALDSRWTIHLSLHHRRGGMYPTGGSWPHPAIYLLDRCRRTRYESDGDHFVSTTRLWLSWHPLSAQRRFVDWVFGEQRIAENDRAEFHRMLAGIEASLRPLFRDFHRLDFETMKVQGETLVVDRVAQALGEELHGRFGMVAADPEEPVFLSHLLAEPIVLNPDFKIGDRYVGVAIARISAPALSGDVEQPSVFARRVQVLDADHAILAGGSRGSVHQGIRRHLLATLGLGLVLNRVANRKKKKRLRSGAGSEGCARYRTGR